VAEGARALSALTGLTTLDLRRNGIGDGGARALSALTGLTTLDLGFNGIGDEGARALSALTGLTTLDLSDNGIGAEGARALSALTGLTTLALGFNRIGDEGARALSALTGLTTLALGFNGIGAEGARALSALTGLTTLALGSNSIGDEGARALSALTGLTTLDLGGNSIKDIGALVALKELEKLTLSRNPIETPCPALWFNPSLREVYLEDATLGDVPRELLSQSSSDNCLERLRAHFRDAAQGSPEIVRDLKVMVLGNGRVGKTQICRRLVGWQALRLPNEDAEFERDARSTHGVQVTRALLPSDEAPTPLHIWDFGGQDLYLGTHALFLRTRAVFPIVWTPQSEKEREHVYAGIPSKNFPLGYWVEYVAQMAGREQPILLIQNQCDGPGDRVKAPRVDADLLDSFGFHKTLAYSAKTKRGHAGLIGALQEAVSFVHETQGMPRIGGGRAFVKRKLEELRDAAQQAREQGGADPALAVIDKTALAALCNDPACVSAGGVENQDQLLYYLHQIGTVFYQPPLFGGRIIVDQQWALEAIYAVFERESGIAKRIRNQWGGRFTRSDLGRYLWDEFGHGEKEQELFLDMMRSCRIAFALREPAVEGAETVYLAPDLLPSKSDVERRLEWDDGAPTFRQSVPFDLLPPGLLRTIMAEIGEEAGVAATYWDNGLYFYERQTRSRAIIEQVPEPEGWAGAITIRTQGGDAETLLAALTQLVKDNQDRLGIGFGEGRRYRHGNGFLDRLGDMLGRGSSRQKKAIEQVAEMRALLEGPQSGRGDGDPRRALDPGPEPLPANACYLSYAWGNSSPDASPEDRDRERAADAICAAAQKKGRTVIRDRDVMRFGDSITNFMNQIAGGQRIYVILSAKYLQSPFCMYELYSIWNECRRKSAVFLDRIRVLALPDARFHAFEDRLAAAEWWAADYEKRTALVANAPKLVSDYDFKAFKLAGEFAIHIGDILALVADTLHPTSIDNIDPSLFD
jgi:internalin A